MSGRVQKSKSHSTVIKDRERAALIKYVESRSIDSDMPCTRCFRAKVPCRFGEKSTRCRTCIAAKKPCDGVLVASTLQRLNSQQKEWDEKEEKAGEELLELHRQFERLQSQMVEAASRLSYIRKIRKKVREKQTEAFERGIQEVDREDGVLPDSDVLSALDTHEKFVVSDLQAVGLENELPWSAFGFGNDFADLGPLVGDAVVGSTSTTQG
ncbi:hypothetical protein CMUS01_12328 [Colletotrichum musicola]|uniref:Zn(2)-C6 fungal-type domain-containing protein n=1 Tax=Colletotrichum musicola TaxID=2175873 RepID=A0A8H6JMV3_9PEZI|nr:hypothetical protein CMUS01_12328 [Colletotrichum musicola]